MFLTDAVETERAPSLFYYYSVSVLLFCVSTIINLRLYNY